MPRRDRNDDLIEDDGSADVHGVQHRCDDGWLDRDVARPCLRCRPWLAERRPPTRDELAVAARTASSAPLRGTESPSAATALIPADLRAGQAPLEGQRR